MYKINNLLCVYAFHIVPNKIFLIRMSTDKGFHKSISATISPTYTHIMYYIYKTLIIRGIESNNKGDYYSTEMVACITHVTVNVTVRLYVSNKKVMIIISLQCCVQDIEYMMKEY